MDHSRTQMLLNKAKNSLQSTRRQIKNTIQASQNTIDAYNNAVTEYQKNISKKVEQTFVNRGYAKAVSEAHDTVVELNEE